jgi:hypothetical protein
MTKFALFLAPAAVLLMATPAMAQDGSRLLEQMEDADSNGDGAVSRTELLNHRTGQFDKFDRNDDGVLDQDDVPRFAKKKFKEKTGGFDQNGDGRVTRTEFNNAPTRGFDKADANGDGLVTKAELNAVRSTLKSKGRR